MTESRNPPRHLSRAAKAWWRSVDAGYLLEDHHVRLLSEAASAWDRAQQARELVDADGLVTVDRFGQSKPHPAVTIERDARVLFARLMRELNLDDAPEAARVPRIGRTA